MIEFESFDEYCARTSKRAGRCLIGIFVCGVLLVLVFVFLCLWGAP
jgi:hypothetical protein